MIRSCREWLTRSSRLRRSQRKKKIIQTIQLLTMKREIRWQLTSLKIRQRSTLKLFNMMMKDQRTPLAGPLDIRCILWWASSWLLFLRLHSLNSAINPTSSPCTRNLRRRSELGRNLNKNWMSSRRFHPRSPPTWELRMKRTIRND